MLLRLTALAATAAIVGVAGCGEIIGLGDPKLAAIGGAGGTGGGEGGMGEGGEAPPPPCHPTDPLCNMVESDCLALVDNSANDKGALRVQQLTIFKPDALASGLEYQAISQAVQMNLEECNLLGGGTINLLVAFDSSNDTARLGAAEPVADPFDGYTFVNRDFPIEGGSLLVEPVTFDAAVADNGTVTATEIPMVSLPLFLDLEATSYVLVPVRQAKVIQTQLSSDKNCIGIHNAAGLRPDNGCLPDIPNNIKSFVEGGRVDGYVLLEEADDVIITAFGLNRSLCLVFAQDVAEFSDGGSPARCVYKDSEIKFPGDWCSATNSGATTTCHDAVKFAFSFAASAVKLND